MCGNLSMLEQLLSTGTSRDLEREAEETASYVCESLAPAAAAAVSPHWQCCTSTRLAEWFGPVAGLKGIVDNMQQMTNFLTGKEA